MQPRVPRLDWIQTVLADPKVEPGAEDKDCMRTTQSSAHLPVVRQPQASNVVRPAAFARARRRRAAARAHSKPGH
jgi:hypothetical protein